jgi:hypothetical protein
MSADPVVFTNVGKAMIRGNVHAGDQQQDGKLYLWEAKWMDYEIEFHMRIISSDDANTTNITQHEQANNSLNSSNTKMGEKDMSDSTVTKNTGEVATFSDGGEVGRQRPGVLPQKA